MTLKEKALELFKNFYKQIFDIDLGINVSKDEKRYESAKQCALIAVDEILLELSPLDYHPLGSYTNPKIEYWQEVKQEIEKL